MNLVSTYVFPSSVIDFNIEMADKTHRHFDKVKLLTRIMTISNEVINLLEIQANCKDSPKGGVLAKLALDTYLDGLNDYQNVESLFGLTPAEMRVIRKVRTFLSYIKTQGHKAPSALVLQSLKSGKVLMISNTSARRLDPTSIPTGKTGLWLEYRYL